MILIKENNPKFKEEYNKADFKSVYEKVVEKSTFSQSPF
jgi:hypothetical protein